MNNKLISIMSYLQLKFLRDNVSQFYKEDKANFKSDSGFDIIIPEDHVIPPKTLGYKIKHGIACKPSEEHGYFLMPRSSIIKTPLRQSNSIGLIDSQYTGEIIAVVDNHDEKPFEIVKGTRLFQLVFPNLKPFNVKYVEELLKTERGCGGFGSTGV